MCPASENHPAVQQKSNTGELHRSTPNGAIIVRIVPGETVSVEIVADKSATEEHLSECLRAARQELEQLCKALSVPTTKLSGADD